LAFSFSGLFNCTGSWASDIRYCGSSFQVWRLNKYSRGRKIFHLRGGDIFMCLKTPHGLRKVASKLEVPVLRYVEKN
jgi:hypothetical protein